jgi:succinyl-CoA synthetase beta subunit
MFTKGVGGIPVRKLLVEERLDFEREIYVAITIDGSMGVPIAMVSSEGGIEIEDIVAKYPERLVAERVDVFSGLEQHQARKLTEGIGLPKEAMVNVSRILWVLYQIFRKYDGTTAEINPLIIDRGGAAYAVGAVLDVDDDALFRHPEMDAKLDQRVEDEIERRASELGLAYVRLDGDIGLIGTGAGLAIATGDLVRLYGGEPANFLDTGGRVTQEHIKNALSIVLMNPKVRGVLINMYGGINPIVDGAQGIVTIAKERRLSMPIVVKVRGNFEEEAWRILQDAGIEIVKDIRTEVAARRITELVQRCGKK